MHQHILNGVKGGICISARREEHDMATGRIHCRYCPAMVKVKFELEHVWAEHAGQAKADGWEALDDGPASPLRASERNTP